MRMPTSLRSYNNDLLADSRSFLQIGSNACTCRSSSVEIVATSTSVPVGIRSSEFGSSREARPRWASRSRVGIGTRVRRRNLGGSHFGSDLSSGEFAIELSVSPLVKSEPSAATSMTMACGPLRQRVCGI
jgi:hypothetical protein